MAISVIILGVDLECYFIFFIIAQVDNLDEV